MNFIDEIKEIETDRNGKENIVIDEIKEYFRDEMNSDLFKQRLKSRIKDAINQGKKTCDLRINFWEYSTGCSNTYIGISGCKQFELIPTDEHNTKYEYKGVRLETIHKRLCSILSDMYKNKLEELGLNVIKSVREDDKYRFHYYEEKITISW